MDFKVDPVSPYFINRILQNPHISEDVKRTVAAQNYDKISQKVSFKMTKAEYKELAKARRLKKYRPLLNSMIKQAEVRILAGALGIDETKINEFILKVVNSDFLPSGDLTKDKIELAKIYIYRHGKKDEVLKLLKHELSDVEHALIYLYRTLEKNSGGLYDYFERPIHLLDNHTAKKMHGIINEGLKNAQQAGVISSDQNLAAADWALRKIYDIQSNYKILKAVRIVRYQG